MSKEKIIVALDVSTAKEAQEIVNELREEVGAFKIGLQLFVAAGANFVQKIVKDGNKVFLDLKFHDIPNTAAKAAVEAARLGVWMFNVHAAGGSEMMSRTIEEVSEVCAKESLNLPKIIGVTVLTSSTDKTLHETGIEANAEAQVLRLAKLVSQSGLHGVVASPREIGIIRREITDKNFLIVTPGIRSQEFKDKKLDDQKRVLSAAESVGAGADYLVIGRPILQASDRRAAICEISSAIENHALTPTNRQ